ncbi:NAD(P)/FAD-dependent oxidoreductase [Mycolicibacterium holsaticum DSM 44478 = JCM 12374]|nr:NAD(P)/FAD-dependent oxidoreductase [Mycolicibacterium holsaticum DSM 44478 = JCM 12374]UNC09416.1 NAD(P)/FAD-dependent oxidoreductase [Mycolicibacterium holsaticum DSM 44478 = JCM 12374]
MTLLLAHAGIPVTLLEKNRYLGGSCAGYQKQGFQIDFGTHMFSRGPRGPLGEVLRRTGSPRAIEFRRTKNIAEFCCPDRSGNVGLEKIPLPNEICRMPAMALRLAHYMHLNLAQLSQAAKLLTAVMTMDDDEVASWNHRTVDEFVAQYTASPRVREALCCILGLYFVLPPWETSAGEGIYCFQRMFRDNWLSYPAGGAKAIPTAYCRLAEARGAEIRTGAGVRRILIADGAVRGVETYNGTKIHADTVISTSSMRTTVLRLCDPAQLPDAYVQRAREIRGSQIAVQLKIALNKPLVDAGCVLGAFGDNANVFTSRGDTIREVFDQLVHGRVPDVIPFYCPVPTNFDPSLAPPGHQLLTMCTLAPTTDVELSSSPTEWKEAMLNTMRKIAPGLDEHVLFIDCTTTSWMAHWIGKEYGPAISTAQTPEQVGAMRPTVVTPITGLYLAGDGAGGRGVGTELAADSAMECAEQVVADLGRTIPSTWRTHRHKQPDTLRSLRRIVRPSPTVTTTPRLRALPGAPATRSKERGDVA